jgi:hypothetical protein
MSTTTWPQRVGTLSECPRCGGCCYAVVVRFDGSLYLARHGSYAEHRICRGPSSADLIDLLMAQEGLRDNGRGSVGAR